jgi:hypothetical protein
VREEQNNRLFFSPEREYFRDYGLKGSVFTNTNKEKGSFSCEKRIYETTEIQTLTLTGTYKGYWL